MRVPKVIYLLLLVLVIVATLAVGFWVTGGKSLVLVYQRYLSKDIPNKELTVSDFVDHGPTMPLSGYYIGARDNVFYIWTLSGVKQLQHQSGTSVYFYIDICSAIKKITTTKSSNAEAPQQTFFTLSDWEQHVKRGEYVAVVRLNDGSNIVDKVWATNNPNYPDPNIKVSECK